MGVLDMAHDRAGAIAEPGTWLDDCEACRMECAEHPDVFLIVRGGASRALVRASDLLLVVATGGPGPEHFLHPGDYVRDISTATAEAQGRVEYVHRCLGGCASMVAL